MPRISVRLFTLTARHILGAESHRSLQPWNVLTSTRPHQDLTETPLKCPSRPALRNLVVLMDGEVPRICPVVYRNSQRGIFWEPSEIHEITIHTSGCEDSHTDTHTHTHNYMKMKAECLPKGNVRGDTENPKYPNQVLSFPVVSNHLQDYFTPSYPVLSGLAPPNPILSCPISFYPNPILSCLTLLRLIPSYLILSRRI